MLFFSVNVYDFSLDNLQIIENIFHPFGIFGGMYRRYLHPLSDSWVLFG